MHHVAVAAEVLLSPVGGQSRQIDLLPPSFCSCNMDSFLEVVNVCCSPSELMLLLLSIFQQMCHCCALSAAGAQGRDLSSPLLSFPYPARFEGALSLGSWDDQTWI